jgi:succinate dehydrogenase / fumarate reductase, membrane anchor subunit
MNKSSQLDATNLTSGVSHWLIQRGSAILLIPLTYPLIKFLSVYVNGTYEQTLAWIQSTTNLVYLTLWFLTVFYHAALGLQVVIEDYVGNRGLQGLLIKLINWGFLGLGLITLIFIYRVS